MRPGRSTSGKDLEGVAFCPAYFGDGADRCILRKDQAGQEGLTVQDREG